MIMQARNKPLSLFLPFLFDFLFFLSSLLAEHLGWLVCEVFKGAL